MTPAEQEVKIAELEKTVEDLLTQINDQNSKIERIEHFITKGQDEWNTPELMLTKGDLTETVKNVVASGFYVNINAEFRSND